MVLTFGFGFLPTLDQDKEEEEASKERRELGASSCLLRCR
jgi:hypothetical protein